MRKRICLILCLLCLSLRLCFFGAKCFSKTWAINPCGRHHRGGGWAYATYSKDKMMTFFLIESLHEIIHCTTYIPSTIVEEITKTSNDRFFGALSRCFQFHVIFHTEMEKCSDRADHTAPILFLGVLTLIFVFLCVFWCSFFWGKKCIGAIIFTDGTYLFPSIFLMRISNLKTKYISLQN